MKIINRLNTHGDLSVVRIPKPDPNSLRSLAYHMYPEHHYLSDEVKQWRRKNLYKNIRNLAKIKFTKSLVSGLHIPTMTAYGSLFLTKIHKEGFEQYLGLAGVRVVTDDGVDYIVDAFQNSVELEIMKYHGIGTNNTAENQTDSDLVSEITTQYATNNTRATGTTTEGGSTNIYETVATNSVDASVAAVEHGIFNNATVGSGVLLDRTVFTVVNLSSGDSLQSTYDLTFTAGS